MDRPPIEFSFLGLEQYFSPRCRDAYIRADVSGPAFVFVDYMGFSLAYAVDMDSGHVIVIGDRSGAPKIVSRTVDEFLEMYVMDDTRLLP